MHLAYITETYPPEVNGVSLSVERAVGYLRGQGHEVDLIRPRQPGEAARNDAGEWRTAGLPIPMYPDLRFGLALERTLAARFERSRPDLVHIATQGPLGHAALQAAVRQGLPVTTDFRTNFHSYSRYYRLGWMYSLISRYLRNFHNRADRTFVPSRMAQRELAASGFKRLEVVGRGVDTEQFSPRHRSAQLRAQWGVTGDERVLLYVGRLAREKNVSLALRAFDMVRYLRPRTRMIVVGDGPLRRQLEREHPAANFVGVQRGHQLATSYASADLFLFPSESETFGNVTLEAMASGLAVIGFDAAAVADHVSNGHNGFAIPRGSETGFIATVCRCVATESELIAPLRLRARETGLRTTWEKELGNFENHLLHTAFSRSLEFPRNGVMA